MDGGSREVKEGKEKGDAHKQARGGRDSGRWRGYEEKEGEEFRKKRE